MDSSLLTIDWDLIDSISYRTNLGKSLKNTLRKFDRLKLFDELSDVIVYFTEVASEKEFVYDNRIKSIQSCKLKYERYYPSVEVEKVFNDILGLRVIVSDYSIFDKVILPEKVRVADMRNGKAKDDGYRGIHLYFQKNHYHYPIEIQFVTKRDMVFNEWLHVYCYKYVADDGVGVRLRSVYESGLIATEEDFRKEFERICAI